MNLNGSCEHVYIRKDQHLTEISDHEWLSWTVSGRSRGGTRPSPPSLFWVKKTKTQREEKLAGLGKQSRPPPPSAQGLNQPLIRRMVSLRNISSSTWWPRARVRKRGHLIQVHRSVFVKVPNFKIVWQFNFDQFLKKRVSFKGVCSSSVSLLVLMQWQSPYFVTLLLYDRQPETLWRNTL